MSRAHRPAPANPIPGLLAIVVAGTIVAALAL